MELLLSRQENSSYVLDLLSEYIDEDYPEDFYGDGYCLLDEIRIELKM